MSEILVAQDTFRILLATDNHIGYLERDPIRGRDSIDTFEEILKLAVKKDVCCFPDDLDVLIGLTRKGGLYSSGWRPLSREQAIQGLHLSRHRAFARIHPGRQAG